VKPPEVAVWMNMSSQIATAGRVQVLEDDRDTFNSDSDSDNERHGEVILDGYKGIKTDSQGNPMGSGYKISNAQVAATRQASATRPEDLSPPGETRKATPMNSDNEDQEEMSEDQKRCIASGKRKAKRDSQAWSTHPMTTRSEEREAGGVRVTAGSGQKDTRATNGRPSKTRVVIFSPAEVSCRLPDQLGSMDQRDLIICHSQWVAWAACSHPISGA
jgi:hypothetical protein